MFSAGTNTILAKPFYLVGCTPNGKRVYLFKQFIGSFKPFNKWKIGK